VKDHGRKQKTGRCRPAFQFSGLPVTAAIAIVVTPAPVAAAMMMVVAADMHANWSDVNANAGLRRGRGQKAGHKDACYYAFHFDPHFSESIRPS
jgi:hypothetical protein